MMLPAEAVPGLPGDAGVLRPGVGERQQAGQWRPAAGAQLFAAFFPAALLVTVEVLARVSWPSGWAWTLARFGGAGLVALVAAVVSYLHLSGLLAAYGEDRLTTWIGPLAVDGLMVVCGFALLAIGRLKSAGPLHSLEAGEASGEAADGGPLVDEEGAGGGRESERPSEASAPAQPVVVDLPSAVVSARAAGLSYQRIADEFGITKHKVTKILKGDVR